MSNNFTKHKIIVNSSQIIFLLIAIWYAVGNFIWWQINTPIIPTGISSLHFNDIFMEGNLFFNAPLLTYIMRFMFFVFGKEHYDLIVIFVNYIFFLISLYFIYRIGVELKDKQTGNIAMILFALVPSVYEISRQYGHQDYHIIAGITFNIYCLIKTNYFKDRKWSIIYGISVGLGLMIKDAFLAYFFVPFIYIVIQSLKQNIKLEKIVNILLSIALGSFIAGWHYFRIWIISKIWHEPVVEIAPIFSFDSMRVMTIGLWEELLSPPIFIIFIIGIVWFIWKYKNEYKYIVMLWFIVPLVIIIFMPHHKFSEYGLGFIPAMILISAVFLSNMKRQLIKNVTLVIIVIIGLLQYVDFSYGIDTISLFNYNFKFNNHNISYFNKSMFSNSCSKLDQKTIVLAKILNNYRDKTIFIDTKFNKDTLETCIDLYSFPLIFKFDNWINIISINDDIDIVVLFDKKSIEDQIEQRKEYYDIHPYTVIHKAGLNEKINELKRSLIEREQILNRDFELKHNFCLEENNEDTRVLIFERKNK